jgi:nucleoside 2-deoxyribosyltransferase
MTKRVVFISYSHRDSDLAKKIGTALERVGLEAFNSERELRTDKDWRKETQAAIKRSDALIMLVAAPHSSSSWTSYEAGMAAALGKRVMVLLPNKYPATELPADVTAQVVDFDPQAPERAAHDIAARLAVV